MDIFITLLLKLIPLYILIFLGYIAGRFLHVRKESIAHLLIYIIAPVIVFNGVFTTKISVGALSLPFLFFSIATGISVVFYWIGKRFWSDSTKNILGFASGAGSTGYFGLPVTLVLFSDTMIGYVVLAILGIILFENSVGFFITAKGHHTALEALVKVLKLPALYAFFLAFVMNISGISFGPIYTDMMMNFRGAYTILGMMLIGLALSALGKLSIDYRFLILTFLAKFLIWPLMIFGVIMVDTYMLHLYGPSIHRVMILLSVVPIAANTVAYATALNAQPEEASIAVLLSTLFALLYIPLIAQFFL